MAMVRSARTARTPDEPPRPDRGTAVLERARLRWALAAIVPVGCLATLESPSWLPTAAFWALVCLAAACTRWAGRGAGGPSRTHSVAAISVAAAQVGVAWLSAPMLGGAVGAVVGLAGLGVHRRIWLGVLGSLCIAPLGGLATVAGLSLAVLLGRFLAQQDRRRDRARARRRFRRERSREDRDQNLARQEREQHKIALAQAAKDLFLSNISHEIRTPMTAILGYSELLVGVESNLETNRAHVAAIRRNGRKLLAIVDDLLDISKLEAGRAQVEKAPCSLARILSTVLSNMTPRAQDKDLQLALEFTSPVPRTVVTDATRLQQILTNLVANAIKFTTEGWVRILVRATAPGETPANVRITVSDMGVGVTEEERERIFEPFHQEDTSLTRRAGGSGLGLTLARDFARKLGGNVEVRSRPGAGSSFTLTFDPQRIDAHDLMHDASEVAVDATPSVPDQRIEGRAVIVEDGPDNQLLLTALLKRLGLKVSVAANGREGVDLICAEQAKGQPFDLILMDMQMPEMDGYEATRRLRAHGLETPILAITAHAMASDRQKCLDAGCTDYVTKPVRRNLLEGAIRELMRPAPTTRER